MGRKLILLVEDDPDRAEKIQSCVPGSARCIWARSAGAAIGILRRDAFACVLLDHDLEPDPRSSGLDGRAVAKAVCETQSRATCNVLVHSQNVIRGASMLSYLKQAGFRTERCPWSDDTPPLIREWLASSLGDE
jgi:CheY-like chemotaxis protein